MKAAKRIATVLKIIGWVIVALAVGVTIYSLATSGGPWGTMKNWLSQGGINQNIIDRVDFDHQYYNALIDAADTKKMLPYIGMSPEEMFEAIMNAANDDNIVQ